MKWRDYAHHVMCVQFSLLQLLFVSMLCLSCVCTHVEGRGQPSGVCSLYHVNPDYQTQVTKLGDKCLFPLSHLSDFLFLF